MGSELREWIPGLGILVAKPCSVYINASLGSTFEYLRKLSNCRKEYWTDVSVQQK